MQEDFIFAIPSRDNVEFEEDRSAAAAAAKTFLDPISRKYLTIEVL